MLSETLYKLFIVENIQNIFLLIAVLNFLIKAFYVRNFYINTEHSNLKKRFPVLVANKF